MEKYIQDLIVQKDLAVHDELLYTYNINDIVPDEKTVTDMLQRMSGTMRKQHYQLFVTTIGDIYEGMLRMRPAVPMADDLIQLVQARIAFTCAGENEKFDSFVFDKAVKKELAKRRASLAGAFDAPTA